MNFRRHLRNMHLRWSPFAAIAGTTSLPSPSASVLSYPAGRFIFQNLLYVPIIIACVYYVEKGFAFSVALSFVYLFLVIALAQDWATTAQAFIRIFIFVGVAGVITFLSVQRRRVEKELRQHRENLERLVEERTAELKQMAEEAKQLNQKIEFVLGATHTGLDIIDSELHIR